MKSTLFSDLFTHCILSLEADFISGNDMRSVSSSLSAALGIKVKDVVSKWTVKLELCDSKIFRLTTDFMNHVDIRLFIINFNNWIKLNAQTSTFCDFNISVKLNTNVHKIESLDKIKFILNFDEPYVYSIFPKRTNCYNAQTIRQISSNRGYVADLVKEIDSNVFDVPHNNFMGINFDNIAKGYLTMRYLGGLDYQTKTTEILKIINHFCSIAFLAVTEKRIYNNDEVVLFNKILNKKKNLQKSYETLEIFTKTFPNIKFLVNLIEDKMVLKTHYFILRDRIYDVISNIKSVSTKDFYLNYDSTTQTLQLKDAEIECLKLKNVQFIECKIKGGVFSYCDFFKSEINKSYIENSNLFTGTKATSSKLINCFTNRTVDLKDCFIDGQNSVLNASVVGGIIAMTNKGIFAKISDSTIKGKITEIKPGFLTVGSKVIIK